MSPPQAEDDKRTEVSYPSLAEDEKQVFYRKFDMYKAWANNIADYRLATPPESSPGRAVGAQSALWSESGLTGGPVEDDLGHRAAGTLAHVTRVASSHTGLKADDNRSKKLAPSSPINSAMNPPVPLLAQEPTIRVSPPRSGKPAPQAPGDSLTPPTGAGSTRAQRDAYLASATNLPLDLIAEVDGTRPVSSLSSKLTGARIASLLSIRTRSPAGSLRSPSGKLRSTARRPSAEADQQRVSVSTANGSATAGTWENREKDSFASVGLRHEPPPLGRSITNLTQAPRSPRKETASPGPARWSMLRTGQTSINPMGGLATVDSDSSTKTQTQSRLPETNRTLKSGPNSTSPPLQRRLSRKPVPTDSGELGDGSSTLVQVPEATGSKKSHGSLYPRRDEEGTVSAASAHRKALPSTILGSSKVTTAAREAPRALGSHRSERDLSSHDQPSGVRPTGPSMRSSESPGTHSVPSSRVVTHRQQLPLPRPSLSRSYSSAKGVPHSLGRRYLDGSSANLDARFEPASYPLPVSGSEADALSSPTKLSLDPTLVSSTRNAPQSKGKSAEPPSRISVPSIFPDTSPHPADRHQPRPSTKEPKSAPILSATTADRPHVTIDRSPSDHPTIIIPSSPPAECRHEADRLSFEVPSGSRGRLRVSLAWLRDGGRRETIRRDDQSGASSPSPPPVPRKGRASFTSRMRESVMFRTDWNRDARNRHHLEPLQHAGMEAGACERPPSLIQPPTQGRFMDRSRRPPAPPTIPSSPIPGWPYTHPVKPFAPGQSFVTPQVGQNGFVYPQPAACGPGGWVYPGHSGVMPSQLNRFGPGPALSLAPPSPPRPASVEPPSSTRDSPPPMPPSGLSTVPTGVLDRGGPIKGTMPWYIPDKPFDQPGRLRNRLFPRFLRGRRADDGMGMDYEDEGTVKRWRSNVRPMRRVSPTQIIPDRTYRLPMGGFPLATIFSRRNRPRSPPPELPPRPDGRWSRDPATTRPIDLAVMQREQEKEGLRRMKVERRNRREAHGRGSSQPNGRGHKMDGGGGRSAMSWPDTGMGKRANGFGAFPQPKTGGLAKREHRGRGPGMIKGWVENLRRYTRRGESQLPRGTTIPRSHVQPRPQARREVKSQTGNPDVSRRSSPKKWGDRARSRRRK